MSNQNHFNGNFIQSASSSSNIIQPQSNSNINEEDKEDEQLLMSSSIIPPPMNEIRQEQTEQVKQKKLIFKKSFKKCLSILPLYGMINFMQFLVMAKSACLLTLLSVILPSLEISLT
jgi:hypothetical protein